MMSILGFFLQNCVKNEVVDKKFQHGGLKKSLEGRSLAMSELEHSCPIFSPITICETEMLKHGFI